MSVEINWLAIGLGALAPMVLGFTWYHAKVFGTLWMNLANLNEDDLKKQQGRPILVSTLWAILISFALYHIIYVSDAFYTEYSWFTNSIGVGIWVGLIFASLTTIMHGAFELRPTKLDLINAGFDLASVVAAAIVIGLIGS